MSEHAFPFAKSDDDGSSRARRVREGTKKMGEARQMRVCRASTGGLLGGRDPPAPECSYRTRRTCPT